MIYSQDLGFELELLELTIRLGMSLRDETSSTFSQRKTYWKARSGLRQLRFVCFRALFGARIRARETRIFTSSFGALVRVSLFDVVVGIGLAVALQVVSLHIGRWSHKHGFLVEDAESTERCSAQSPGWEVCS